MICSDNSDIDERDLSRTSNLEGKLTLIRPERHPLFGSIQVWKTQNGLLVMSVDSMFPSKDQAMKEAGKLRKRLSRNIPNLMKMLDFESKELKGWCGTAYTFRSFYEFYPRDLHTETVLRSRKKAYYSHWDLTHILCLFLTTLNSIHARGEAFLDLRQCCFARSGSGPGRFVLLEPLGERPIRRNKAARGAEDLSKVDVLNLALALVSFGNLEVTPQSSKNQAQNQNTLASFKSFKERYESENPALVEILSDMLNPKEDSRPTAFEALSGFPPYEEIIGSEKEGINPFLLGKLGIMKRDPQPKAKPQVHRLVSPIPIKVETRMGPSPRPAQTQKILEEPTVSTSSGLLASSDFFKVNSEVEVKEPGINFEKKKSNEAQLVSIEKNQETQNSFLTASSHFFDRDIPVNAPNASIVNNEICPKPQTLTSRNEAVHTNLPLRSLYTSQTEIKHVQSQHPNPSTLQNSTNFAFLADKFKSSGHQNYAVQAPIRISPPSTMKQEDFRSRSLPPGPAVHNNLHQFSNHSKPSIALPQPQFKILSPPNLVPISGSMVLPSKDPSIEYNTLKSYSEREQNLNHRPSFLDILTPAVSNMNLDNLLSSTLQSGLNPLKSQKDSTANVPRKEGIVTSEAKIELKQSGVAQPLLPLTAAKKTQIISLDSSRVRTNPPAFVYTQLSSQPIIVQHQMSLRSNSIPLKDGFNSVRGVSATMNSNALSHPPIVYTTSYNDKNQWKTGSLVSPHAFINAPVISTSFVSSGRT